MMIICSFRKTCYRKDSEIQGMGTRIANWVERINDTIQGRSISSEDFRRFLCRKLRERIFQRIRKLLLISV